MISTTNDPKAMTFEAPDGGSWMLDTTHHGRRPVTRFLQPIYRDVFPAGMGALPEQFGLPLKEFRVALIHGCFYVRPMAIGEPDNPKGEPPLLAMKLLARLHPELRRRNRTARQAWQDKRWRRDVDRWFDHDREPTVAANLRFQDVDPSTLSDIELADHLTALFSHFSDLVHASFATHGGDLIPIGDFMAHCGAWGVDPGVAASLLAGSSPASIETAEILRPVGRAVAAATAGSRAAAAGSGAVAVGSAASPAAGLPASVDALRDLDAGVGPAIDRWLRHHGHRVMTSDDIDGETLIERPDLQLKALLSADADRPGSSVAGQLVPIAAVEAVRSQVPGHDRALFDELLAEARYGLRLRDDNVGVRWNWPAGLLRRAVLEAGNRFVERGHLAERDHAMEFDVVEIDALLRGRSGPGIDELAERWRLRQLTIASEPPLNLGPEPGKPPLAAFPAPLARATAAILAMIEAMEGRRGGQPLTGVGIGSEACRGRAVVVADAMDALERVEPGDVVIAPFTGPSWNSLLPVIGGLVVEEGGPMCHAAIVAREFAIPAIVGVADATRLVPDGASVSLDPVAGRLTIVDEAPSGT